MAQVACGTGVKSIKRILVVSFLFMGNAMAQERQAGPELRPDALGVLEQCMEPFAPDKEIAPGWVLHSWEKEDNAIKITFYGPSGDTEIVKLHHPSAAPTGAWQRGSIALSGPTGHMTTVGVRTIEEWANALEQKNCSALWWFPNGAPAPSSSAASQPPPNGLTQKDTRTTGNSPYPWLLLLLGVGGFALLVKKLATPKPKDGQAGPKP